MGRPAALTFKQMIAVGGECERIWLALAQDLADQKYEAQPFVMDLRKEQAAFQSTPISKRRAWRAGLKDFSDGIKDILLDAHERGLTKFITARPYRTKNTVKDAGVTWCHERYGIKITRRRAQECWVIFRELQEKLRSGLA